VKFIIERPQAQEILNYLQAQPYVQVFKLIAMLTGLKPLEDSKAHDHPGGENDTSEVHEDSRRA
jgi:hypothetical protein